MKIRQFTITLFITIILNACATLSQPEPTTTALPPTAIPTPPSEFTVKLDPSVDLKKMRPNSPIILRFNQPVDIESMLTPISFSPHVFGEIEWNDNQTTLTFTPKNGYHASYNYRFSVYTTLKSRTGLNLSATRYWIFTLPDNPRITVRNPREFLDPDEMSFVATFNRSIQRESFASVLSVVPQVPLDYSWLEDGSVKITIQDDPVPGAQYRFSLEEGAIDAIGTSISPTSWVYTVTPLQVEFHRVGELTTQPDIQLIFNYPVDKESVATALSIDPPIQYQISWNTDATMATLKPTQPFMPEEEYKIELNQQAKTPNGERLESETTFRFLMDPIVESIRSKATTGLAPLMITFNYAMDNESVENALQFLPALDYEVSWSSTSKVLTIQPNAGTLANNRFSLSFRGQVDDLHGNPFTITDRFSFVTPSPIVKTVPLKRDYGRVDPATDIVITFDRAMDPETTGQALVIDPSVEGELIWHSDRELELIPSEDFLAEDTEYIISLQVTALDVDGNVVLGDEVSWSIRTTARENRAGFGETGANLQVVDIDGRRVVHFAIRDKDSSISFELYRITLEQFIQNEPGAYRSYWDLDSSGPFEMSGASLVAAWDHLEGEVEGVDRSYTSVGEAVIPDHVPSGLYVLNMITDHVDDQLLVVMTRNSVSIKLSHKVDNGGQITTWVNNVNGRVIPGASIAIYDSNGNRLKTGQTNSSGIHQTKLAAGERPYLIVARAGLDISVSGISGDWGTYLSPSRRWRSSNSENQYYAYIYTDRPIYRPGQTAYFKGVVRRDDDANYSLPIRDQEVTLNVRDARGNLLQIEDFVLNSFGTFNGSFEIADGAMLGPYTIEVLIGADEHSQTFKVQEYTKPDFQLHLQTDAQQYLVGDPVRLNVDVEYLLGEPVRNADLKVNWYQLRTYGSYYYSRDAESWLNDAPTYYWTPIKGQNQSGSTDENGQTSFDFSAPTIDSYYWDYYRGYYVGTFAIEVTVDDGSNQPVSAFAIIKTYYSTFQLSVDTGGFFYDPGQKFTVATQLDSAFGESVDGREVSIEIEKRIAYNDYKVLHSDSGTSNADGVTFFLVSMEEAGYYRMTIFGEDPHGNAYSRSRWVYIRNLEGTWINEYTSEISIRSAKDTYTSGDTAQFVIESSFDGQALLTVERGTVLEERIINVQTGLNVINLPIKSTYSPNIYVVVQGWEPQDTSLEGQEYAYSSVPDSRLRMDGIMLKIPDDGNKLDVTIAADREVYQPRDEATYEIQVTDQSGNPVSAELSLSLVDEAIFLLADDPSGDIHDAFTRLRALGVYTYNSFSPSRALWVNGMGGGGGGGDEDYAANPRSDFPDTVVWLPVVHTDENGHASITVDLPDTLTSWRLTVKAVTRDSKVGQGEINVVTKLPLVVRPLPPQNLLAGDSFEFSVILHNFTDKPQAVMARVSSDQVEWQEQEPRFLRMEPGEQVVIGWPAVATESGDVEITVSMGSMAHSDAVTVTIPVQPLAIPTFQTDTGIFEGDYSTIIEFPRGALPESNLHIEVSSDISGTLLNGLEYLTGFPYGCVEQVMSRALPNAVVARAFDRLNLSDRKTAVGLDQKISASIARLYALQHHDGGWGWWYDDSSDEYQTAWVIYGLGLIADAGYLVDEKVITRGVEWLADNLEDMDIRTQAFALYAMAIVDQGDYEATQALITVVESLDSFSQAALTLTLFELEDIDSANAILDIVADTAVSDSIGRFYWEGNTDDGKYDRKTMSSSVRTTALVVDAMVKLDSIDERTVKAVDWLMSQRKHRGWGTTNETSFAILGLTDFILSMQQSAHGSVVTLLINGEEVAIETFGEDNLVLNFDISPVDLGGGIAQIQILSDQEQPLYYLISSQMYVAEEQLEGQGLKVTRRYLDPSTKREVHSVQPGQLVLVELTVTLPEAGNYFLLEDHLPGGLEAVNENLNSTSHEVLSLQGDLYYETESSFRWQNYGYNYKEIHPDRVSFFITYLRAGTHKYTYLARVVTPGEYHAMPTEFYAMYDLEYWGRSASSKIVVAKPEEVD